MKLIAATFLFALGTSSAFAQNCKTMPMGPERRACFEQLRGGGGNSVSKGGGKRAECAKRATSIGSSGRGSGRSKFIADCVAGKY